MATVDPPKINQIRTQFGWSAGELGEFLGRAKATIYYWENGENQPGEAMSALLECLHREMECRKQQMSAQQFEEWVEDLKSKKVSGFLRDLQDGTDPTRRPSENGRASRDAIGEDLTLITDESQRPVLCLLPFDREEFEELVGLLSENRPRSRDLARLLLRTAHAEQGREESQEDLLEGLNVLNA